MTEDKEVLATEASTEKKPMEKKPRATTAKSTAEKKPKATTAKPTAEKKAASEKQPDKYLELVYQMADALSEKKAIDIMAIKVEHLTTLADYFIICSARSTSAVRALYDNLDEKMSKMGEECRRREGIGEARWIAMDYGSVLVHIFLEEVREFYQLERLWIDESNLVDLSKYN